MALSGSKWLSLFVSLVVYFLLRSPRAGRREGHLVGEKPSVARQGGFIPLSSLQSSHVRGGTERQSASVCKFMICVCRFIIRNVIKMSEGLARI